ncbi:MAG: hypothetical protein A2747_00965 [Candidatus Yonathbacteria bacterium RIFCSPHIGHO2_01_FULL_44_41]|uniref:Uncharacterized protein n=1 Tax=Candidatus Yonathbacteria bacterium RIFCSPHIGHO2_02_FULL_44_14 TaxID=1802724 RepID=A0A1G2S841_9BACT|nr:MAG: hypothetical protein A2747_00965 [Candidatus Yonathbacteria bacterium RIFCSPHIGHO2_01_FULL_44_41]OHA80441.1 MAG: hypothetical protein A3D51_03430 [Candidatus Yonathbacteria bacterium RIFCSPHIGHO2_02_FULL_44_14]OHA81695.1 MAG: hypothetical protein A3B06_02765 [Candidatus Yonathbacteria bacterium RIFCSPLOWO2_01_FULL_43_20]
METETEQIFKEQLGKLPAEVVDFISSASWEENLDEIAALYNLPEKEQGDFKLEVTLVLAGLIHPDAFSETLEQEVGIKGSVLEAIVRAVEQKIFSPIRPALVDFLEKEAVMSEEEEKQEEVIPEEAIAEEPRVKAPDVAPDNLPVAEETEPLLPLVPFKLDEESTEPLIPPIPPKTPHLEASLPSEVAEPPHPFEEKMKQVFTAGMQPMVAPKNELMTETQTPSVYNNTIKPLTPHVDPYREPIE